MARSLVQLLAIGFVPALIVAWVFERTPSGVRRDEDVPVAQSIAPLTARRMDRAIIVVLVCALAYFAVDKFVLAPQRANVAVPAAATVASDTSIAVLPFGNVGSDKEQDYFSDGLSDELLNQLAQLPQLRVIARTSSFSFKEKQVDVATIVRALNVANLLEGSVRKEGNTLRITAQLVRAADSSELWSHTYDRQLTDVFKIHDDISAQVVAALKLKPLPAQRPAGTSRTDNMQAYNHYLRASQLTAANTLAGWQQAIVEYQHAVDLDPGYTAAYTGMANAYGNVGDLGGDTHSTELATRAMNQALVLTPDDPYALATRAWLRITYSWDWQGARSDYEATLKSDPGNADVLGRYAWLLAALGRLPEATAMSTHAHALDPLNDSGVWTLSLFLNASGQYAQTQALLQNSPTASTGQYTSMALAESLVLAGKSAEAAAALQSAPPIARLTGTALAEHSLSHPDASTRALDALEQNYASGSAFQIAEIHAWHGEKDQAFQWLEQAYTQHDGGMPMIKWSPFLASLRGDPRYAPIVKKMGLPE